MFEENDVNILYIWDADYPWDVRVEKICESLKAKGHCVHIASRNLKKLPVKENLNGIIVHRLKAWRSSRLNYFLSFPFFFSPVWKRFLSDIIKTESIDIIIVRDLPMCIAGIWAGKRADIPVIFDMAEDYVAMISDIWKARKFHGLNLIIRNPYLAKFVERYAFKQADHILVVVDEAIEVVEKGGGDAAKVTIVSNTPELESFSKEQIVQNVNIDLIKSHSSLIYTGGVQMGRGIQFVIEAIPEIVRQLPDFLFVVVGDGYAREQLNKIIAEKSLDKYVLWVGWVEHSELYEYIKACSAGIIPHIVTDHVDTTIPNKIFDYMGCGIPVISSNSRPLQRIIDEEECGLIFESGNASELAKAVISTITISNDYGIKGLETIREKYNWQVEEKRLHSVLKNMINTNN